MLVSGVGGSWTRGMRHVGSLHKQAPLRGVLGFHPLFLGIMSLVVRPGQSPVNKSPVPLIMGDVGISKALRPIVGRNHAIQGWTRRPVFSGGHATDEAIRLTLHGAPLRDAPGRCLGLVLDWLKLPPKHREDLRRENHASFLAGGGEPPGSRRRTPRNPGP